jgi:thiosulfate/3-mercaptopyruvate sulfurtransferase
VAYTTLIDVTALRALIGKAVILDCRFDLAAPEAGQRAFLERHIPTAQYLDLNRDLSAPVSAATGRHPLPEPGRLAARLAALGLGSSDQAVCYDESNGSFAARAWWLLRWLGHPRTAVLDGGLKAWLADGGAVEAGEARARPVDAAASWPDSSADAAAIVTTPALLEALRDPARLLVDARAAERFQGRIEPIDPVAGHVPGAVNHPLSTNLREDGRFLPPEELRRRWLERLAGRAPADVIAMCGSGVTACHNLLAMEHAGLGGAKLYAGSWSEWIRDPNRPIARG